MFYKIAIGFIRILKTWPISTFCFVPKSSLTGELAMKYLALFILLASTSLFAQAGTPDLNLIRAVTKGAEVKIRLRISDQSGAPVEGARVWGGISTGGGMDDFTQIDMLSDSNGFVTICGRCTDKVVCRITKDGYYATELEHHCYNRDEPRPVVSGKWQPYGKEIAAKLKKIIKPSLTGGPVRDQPIPVFDKWIGYDLEVRDWIAPYGTGVFDDVSIRYSYDKKSRREFDCKLEMSFEKWPYAGVIEMQKETFSEMQNTYYAPSGMVYASTIEFEMHTTAKQWVKKVQLDKKSYLIFRTRTETDSKGLLVGAHYGRIDGALIFSPNPYLTFGGVFFNGKSNDINLEDKATAERSLNSARWQKQLELERLEEQQKKVR